MRYTSWDAPPEPRPPTPPEHIQEYFRLHWYGPNYQRFFKPKIDRSAPKPHSEAAKRLIARYGLKKKGDAAKVVHGAASGTSGKCVQENAGTPGKEEKLKSDSQPGVTVRDSQEKADPVPSDVPPAKSAVTHLKPDASDTPGITKRHIFRVSSSSPSTTFTDMQVEKDDQTCIPSSSVTPSIAIADTEDLPEVPSVPATSMVLPDQSISDVPAVETDIPMEVDSEHGASMSESGLRVDDAAIAFSQVGDRFTDCFTRPHPMGICPPSSTNLPAPVDSSQDMATLKTPLALEAKMPSGTSSIASAPCPVLHRTQVEVKSREQPKSCGDHAWSDPMPPAPVCSGSAGHPRLELLTDPSPYTPASGMLSSTSPIIPRTPTPPWGYRSSADIQHDARSLEEPVEAALIACFIAAEARLERILAPARQGHPPWRPATSCGAQWLESVLRQEQGSRDASSNSGTT